MTRQFLKNYRSDPDFSSMVSSILIPQSYVSLEFILQRHAILTEITYPVSAITIKQTRVIENRLGTFSYRNIKEDLYTGFEFYMNILGFHFPWRPCQAIFDYLYLRPLSLVINSSQFNHDRRFAFEP